MNYYVYVFHRGKGNGADNYYWYERTCGTEYAAKSRVAELAVRGQEALYLINHLIRGALY